MKELPRGPFTRLRWFCADGTIHPPKPYACSERGGGLLEALASDPDWLDNRFLVLREAVRLLPHDAAHLSFRTIRGLAAAIADRDSGFRGLRGKIHGRPDAVDAQRVRDYARSQGAPGLADDYRELADAIDATFAANDVDELLAKALDRATGERITNALTKLRKAVPDQSDPGARMTAAATGMALLRAHLDDEPRAATRVALLDTSLELANYRQELDQLGRISQWAGNRLLFHFGDSIVGFDEIVAAFRRVWASPFTSRAFAWRQSLMDRPEHVYASVLLQVAG